MIIRLLRKEIPRLPLEGNLDLTYRCNNACLHCWLWLPHNSPRSREELSLTEIVRIVEQARAMGCRSWAISGGEPMLRPDFIEIFEVLTYKGAYYSLNTNGTLITPKIARLLTRKGRKMITMYGATAEVHDRVTRTPGSFDAFMRGFAYLKEAGASFIVQITPMRANYHQFNQMEELALSLSPYIRIGADWLCLSADRSGTRNVEIQRQRLDPDEIITINEPKPMAEIMGLSESHTKTTGVNSCEALSIADDRIFSSCISARRDFHIDPYGQMTFCSNIKDPDLRYDLRRGTFREAWDEFIPSLAELIHGGQEYLNNCASCELRQDCHWCGVYSYLEHGRYSAKINYLCQLAVKTHQFKAQWISSHVRYFQIAGITLQVSVDYPPAYDSLPESIRSFEVEGIGEDTITLAHFSSVPPRSELRLGKLVYKAPPFEIYRQRDAWIYMGISSENENSDPALLAIFNEDHTRGMIYRANDFYIRNGLYSLTSLSSDQIILARFLADRQGCYLHAAGMIVKDKGLLFVGHSGLGKSTMMKMLKGYGEILCDDRIILRCWPDGFRIHGTWSHGELPDVSPSSAPLKAIFYLEQAPNNQLIPIVEKRERIGLMLSHVVKPLVTADWWVKILDLAGKVSAEVDAYRLRFDKSGQVIDLLRDL